MKNGNQHWLAQAQQTHATHVNHLKLDKSWRMQDTAELLGRSIGAISQDLLIIRFLKQDNSIKAFRHAKDALHYIRTKLETEKMSDA